MMNKNVLLFVHKNKTRPGLTREVTRPGLTRGVTRPGLARGGHHEFAVANSQLAPVAPHTDRAVSDVVRPAADAAEDKARLPLLEKVTRPQRRLAPPAWRGTAARLRPFGPEHLAPVGEDARAFWRGEHEKLGPARASGQHLAGAGSGNPGIPAVRRVAGQSELRGTPRRCASAAR